MTPDMNIAREQQFAQQWQLWAALHHFLTAPLLHELLAVIVQQVSPRTATFDQLFDHVLSAAPDELASWLVRPRKSGEALDVYLQSRVHAILWQNDSPCFAPSEPSAAADVKASMLELAVQIGSYDFGQLKLNWAQVQQQCKSAPTQPSFANFLGVMHACGETASLHDSALPADLARLMDTLPAPLNALLAKHLGDLYADVDAWDNAAQLYHTAALQIAQPLPDWKELQSLLSTILIQSQAAATRLLHGAAPAEALLSPLLLNTSAAGNPLAVANAVIDARAFHYQASDALESAPEYRSVLLLPPLLHRSHELSSALQAWLNGDLTESRVQFWAVLRQQVALGSSIEAQITKAFFARSILDRLDDRQAESLSQDSFQIAVRLLLESGNTKCAAGIRWHDLIVNRFVDESCASTVERQAIRYPACAEQRQHVLLVLFGSWCELLLPERADVAYTLLKSIASLAQIGPTSIVQSRNLGGEALEALTHIAARRPEWCAAIAVQVAEAVIARLSRPVDWRACITALETVSAYAEADAFREDQVRDLVNCALHLADHIPSASQNWLLIRRLLTFLISAPVKRLATSMPELGQRIVATILRFGAPNASEHTRVMFFLHDFDAALFADESIARHLKDNVTVLRQLARATNASYVAENILALLIAPAISGPDGVKVAIDALGDVITDALKLRSPSMGLPYAYRSLMLLADNQELIARDVQIDPIELRTWLQPLLAEVVSLWNRSKEHPEVFATFSLPPNTRPNLVTVHNWAYASLAFAQSLDALGVMRAALDTAAADPQLTSAISLGMCTRSLSQLDHDFDVKDILNEGGQAFYETLGRRLALLPLVDEDRAQTLCKALLSQCFRHGPRILDAAVLLTASRLNLGEFIRTCDYANYARKLDNDRDTKLAVEPLIAPFIGRAQQNN